MTCETAKDHLQASLDGRLARSEQVALQGHLADCAACRRHEEQLAALGRALAAEASRDEAVTAPPELMARLGLAEEAPVLAQAPVKVEKPAAWRRWFPAGLAAAAMMVAIGVGQLMQPPATPVATTEENLTDAQAIHMWLDPDNEMVSWVSEE